MSSAFLRKVGCFYRFSWAAQLADDGEFDFHPAKQYVLFASRLIFQQGLNVYIDLDFI